jgi:hypothetical protein
MRDRIAAHERIHSQPDAVGVSISARGNRTAARRCFAVQRSYTRRCATGWNRYTRERGQSPGPRGRQVSGQRRARGAGTPAFPLADQNDGSFHAPLPSIHAPLPTKAISPGNDPKFGACSLEGLDCVSSGIQRPFAERSMISGSSTFLHGSPGHCGPFRHWPSMRLLAHYGPPAGTDRTYRLHQSHVAGKRSRAWRAPA